MLADGTPSRGTSVVVPENFIPPTSRSDDAKEQRMIYSKLIGDVCSLSVLNMKIVFQIMEYER